LRRSIAPIDKVVVVASLVGLLAVPEHAQMKVSSMPVSRDTTTLRLVVDGMPAAAPAGEGACAGRRLRRMRRIDVSPGRSH
jgi:hypothetical protein